MTNKFPIGSQWKTRAGHRAVVVEIEDDKTVIIWHSYSKVVYRHSVRTGACITIGMDELDLLTPWTEPRKGSFWMNIYDEHKDVFSSKDYADRLRKKGCLACVKCDWQEGQGI